MMKDRKILGLMKILSLRYFTCFIVCLLIIPFSPGMISLSTGMETRLSNTIYVGGSGPGNYSRIQNAIDNASDGDTIFVFNGTYQESLEIYKSIDVVGESKENTVLDGQWDLDVVFIGSKSVNLTGFTLTGGLYGIRIASSENINIHDNNITHSKHTGIKILNSTFINISNNYVYKCTDVWYDAGIEVRESSSMNIHNNHILKNHRGVFIMLSDGISFHDNIIESSEVEGVVFTGSSDNIIVHNQFINNGDRDGRNNGLELRMCLNNTLEYNSFINNGIHMEGHLRSHYDQTISTSNLVNGLPLLYYTGIHDYIVEDISPGQLFFIDCVNLTIKDLKIENTFTGIFLAFSKDITVQNVNASANSRGIYLYNSTECRIINNTVFSNSMVGIELSFSFNNTIMYNEVAGAGMHGIYFGYSEFNTITHNHLHDNTNIGAYLDISPNNTISNNEIFSNENGIVIHMASNNTIYQNNIMDNTCGYENYDCNDNFIYNNNFINNKEQTCDFVNPGKDFFNLEYPTGGNYWSDHEGIDLKSGPDQNISGSDGIGDKPHNGDRYPLMVPYGLEAPLPPSNLTAYAGDRVVYLRWDLPKSDGGTPVTNYRIYRGTEPNDEDFLMEIGNMMSYNDTTVSNGITYYYRIRTVTRYTQSIYSNEVNAMPEADMEPDDVDLDEDGLPDFWEAEHDLDPKDPMDAYEDPDKDGLTNLQEHTYGTLPTNPDTDGDGFDDGTEVDRDTNPLDENDFPVEDKIEPEETNWTTYAVTLIVIIAILIMMFLLLNRKRKGSGIDHEISFEEKR